MWKRPFCSPLDALRDTLAWLLHPAVVALAVLMESEVPAGPGIAMNPRMARGFADSSSVSGFTGRLVPERPGYGAHQVYGTVFFALVVVAGGLFSRGVSPLVGMRALALLGACMTVALGAGLGENMTLLPPIPPSQPSESFGIDAEDYRRDRGSPSRWDAGRVHRALAGAAQVCAGILLTLMGISAGKAQSEYGTRTPSLLTQGRPASPPDRDRDPAGTGGSGSARPHLPERSGRLTRVVSCGEP